MGRVLKIFSFAIMQLIIEEFISLFPDLKVLCGVQEGGLGGVVENMYTMRQVAACLLFDGVNAQKSNV